MASVAATSASATSAETSFSSPNRLSQMLPSTADNSNSELMVTRSPTGHFYGGSDHNVMMRHHGVSRNPNAAASVGMFEDYDPVEDDLNLSSELDASFGEKGGVHPKSNWQVEIQPAALQQSCWV